MYLRKIKSTVIGRFKLIDNSFIRFVLVGIMNTLFGCGIYCLFIYWGFVFWLASLMSNVLGVLFNFKTIGTFVFQNNNNKLIFRFILSYIVVYFINIGLIKFFVICLFLNEYYSGIIATPFVAIVSYIIQKNLIFKKR